MLRVFILMMVAGLVSVSVQLTGAVTRVHDLSEALVRQNEANRLQRERNEELSAELASLVSHTDAIEERARRELYMVKADELLFRLETPAEYEKRSSQRSNMPDYGNPNIRGRVPTFAAKKADLYRAPKGISAPPSRDRR